MRRVRHVLYSQQFDRSILDGLFGRADEFRRRMALPSEKLALTQLHRGKTLFSVFYEPSTRTRMSFGAAAQHLGMGVVATENAREFSSAVKGETLGTPSASCASTTRTSSPCATTRPAPRSAPPGTARSRSSTRATAPASIPRRRSSTSTRSTKPWAPSTASP